MKISHNFASVIALGNFNPAIVTPDFLNKDCKLDLGEPSGQSPPFIPVHRSLQFENLSFVVDMEKLQIVETGPKDISKTRILSFFDAYYKKLPYTPLRAVGVNINCNLFDETEARLKALIEKISCPKTYLGFFQISEIRVSETSLQTGTDKTWLSSNYRTENVRGLARQIDAKKEKDTLTLNYNYEAGNLGKNKKRLKLLVDGYEQFCNEFLDFLKFLEA